MSTELTLADVVKEGIEKHLSININMRGVFLVGFRLWLG